MRVAFACILLCAACQPLPATPSPGQNLVQFTAADLANAIAIAQKSTAPQAPLIVSCFTLLQAQLAALQPTAQPAGGATGLATAFVVTDLAAGNMASLLSPAAQAQYAAACGPLVLFTTNQAMSIGAQIASLGVLLAKP